LTTTGTTSLAISPADGRRQSKHTDSAVRLLKNRTRPTLGLSEADMYFGGDAEPSCSARCRRRPTARRDGFGIVIVSGRGLAGDGD
jgi:hypothetical protein